MILLPQLPTAINLRFFLCRTLHPHLPNVLSTSFDHGFTSLVKLAMALSISAYSGDLSRCNGTLLYSQRGSAFEQTICSIHKPDSNLWIVNRGSSDVS
jgi:hypothetical protein